MNIYTEINLYIQSADPVKVVHNRHLSVVIFDVIDDVVLLDVHTDVFFHFLIPVLFELQSALQYRDQISP